MIASTSAHRDHVRDSKTQKARSMRSERGRAFLAGALRLAAANTRPIRLYTEIPGSDGTGPARGPAGTARAFYALCRAEPAPVSACASPAYDVTGPPWRAT